MTLPFDWCYDCADLYCDSIVEKMFAWIVIRVMKSLDKPTIEIIEERGTLVYKQDLKQLFDVIPIRKILHEVYSWYWLWHMMADMLIIQGHPVDKAFNETPGVVIKGDVLTLIFNPISVSSSTEDN